MSRQIKRNNQLWQQEPDGSWARWNTATSTWERSVIGPPRLPETVELSKSGSTIGINPKRLGVVATALGSAVLLGAGVLVTIALPSSEGVVIGPHLISPAPPAQPFIPLNTDHALFEFAPYLENGCLNQPAPRGASMRRLPDGFASSIKPIATLVQSDREVDFVRPVRTKFRSSERIAELITDRISRIPKASIELKEQVLQLLEAIPDEMDLASTYAHATARQVAGFYDSRSKTIIAPLPTHADDLLSEVTLAHELEHALMDQTIGLPVGAEKHAMDSDRALARRTLIEGDATLFSNRYSLLNLSASERALTANDPRLRRSQGVRLPHFLEKSASFPYNEGLLFACKLFVEGGWKAIDRAYRHPPSSTAEILFPDRFGKRQSPRDVPDPRPPTSWERTGGFELGAAEFLWLLEAPGGKVTPRSTAGWENVRAWDGGEIHTYERSGALSVVVSVAADRTGMSKRDAARQMCGQTRSWFFDSWPRTESGQGFLANLDIARRDDGGYVLMTCLPFGPRLVFAPSLKVAGQFLGTKL